MAVHHEKSPLTHALDLVVFGPVGLALTARDALPAWVDKGRSRMLHQVDVARMVGEHATRHGQRIVAARLVGLGILPGPPPPRAVRGQARPARPVPPVAARPGSATASHPFPPAAGPPAANGRTVPAPPPRDGPLPIEVGPAWHQPVSGSAQLAIPGYDSLSALQVVQRLAGLAPEELEAVRAYEAAARGRRTILTKISQLQTGPA